MKFDFYSDPGHAWLKVPKQLLAKLGISSKITPYSYERGNFAYLEEDSDAYLFIKTMKEHGFTVAFKEHFTNRSSKIRNYSSYGS